MTNPAGSAIVNAIGPIRQIVQNSATAERRYLVIAPGEPSKYRGCRAGPEPMNDMLRLIEPVIPALRRYARALVRNRATADDLVQDCLERAVSHWGQRREGDPRPWLFTILHNLAVNQFRRSAYRGKHIAIDEANEDDFGQDAVQEQKLMYQDVLDKLARLPEDQRAVLLLVAVEDLSYADAARVLDIPVGTVMSRLSRAREKLQQEIEGTADGAPKNVVPVAEHEMTNRPITEDDLHAYVDGVLEPEREAEVAAYLEGHPDMARRVSAFSDQRDLLRKALAPIADEPLPPQLNLSRMIENRRRRPSPVWWAVAAMLMLSIGGLGGWVMRGSLQASPGGLAALAQEAAYSYSVYAPDRVRPVEMRAIRQRATGAVGIEPPEAAGEAAGPDGFGLSPDGRAADRDVARPRRDVHV